MSGHPAWLVTKYKSSMLHTSDQSPDSDPSLRRLGPQTKCPACGWRIDSDAYRCPKCFIYFCWKCRKRVPKSECQYQCANQSCGCYGKLLCSACTVMVPEYRDTLSSKRILLREAVTPKSPISEAIAVGGLLVAAAAFFIVFFNISGWFLAGLAALGSAWAVIVFSGWLSSEFKAKTVPAEYRQEQTTKKVHVADHRCCIQCRQPAEDLS